MTCFQRKQLHMCIRIHEVEQIQAPAIFFSVYATDVHMYVHVMYLQSNEGPKSGCILEGGESRSASRSDTTTFGTKYIPCIAKEAFDRSHKVTI